MTDRSDSSGGKRDSEGLQFLILHRTSLFHQCNIILLTGHVFLMNLRDGGPCVTVDEVVVFSLGLFFTLCSVICGIPISLTQVHSEVAMCACYCQNEFVSQAPKMNLTETQNSMGTAQMWCFWSVRVHQCLAERTCCGSYERNKKMNKELIFPPPIE